MNPYTSTSLQYLYLLSFCFLLSLLLNGILLKFSKNLGKRNTAEYLVRWASEQKPSLGGISFYIVFLVSYSIYSIFFDLNPGTINVQHLGILMACGLAFLMGLSDDAYNTKPLLKFSVQFLSGIILISTGTVITVFPYDMLNYIATIFWVVAIMNSINMLDNMDGITTIVSLAICSIALMIGAYNGQNSSDPFFMTSLIAVIGGLMGFLFYNWNPSKIFMGDTGSQFLGVFLATIGILYFWNYKDASGIELGTKQFTIMLLAFIVPIIDTTTVVINRLRRGQSPFIGGKDHTTHHLSYEGFSDRQVGLTMGGLSFFSLVVIWFITHEIETWNLWYAAGFMVYFLMVFGYLYHITRKHKIRDIVNGINQQREAKKAKPAEKWVDN